MIATPTDEYAEQLQTHENYPQRCPDVYNADTYTFCHYATTVTGRDPLSEKIMVVAITCKRWGCPYCCNRKIRRLAWMSKNAKPNRLLTVTHSDKHWESGEECWKVSAKQFPELIRFIRKETGECEYLRVLELQANGMPHFHAMLRSSFLPQRKIHAEWNRLCGKAGVNIKKIDETFATFRYLVKYLTKLHKIPWTDRHVSYSRDFFRPEDKEEVAYAKLSEITMYDDHPWVWLRERLAWEHVTVLGDGKWVLPDEVPDKQFDLDPATIGLPAAKQAEPKPPKSQLLVPGLEDVLAPNEEDHLNANGKKRARTKRTPIVPIAPTHSSSNPVPF